MSNSAGKVNLAQSNSEYFEIIKNLFNEQLYTNVITLSGFILTLTEKLPQTLTNTEQVHVLVFCGDSACKIQEYHRAEAFYKRAIQFFKSLMKSNAELRRILPEECDLKYKMYLCNIYCKKPSEALQTLESISVKQRTAKVNMALGNLYKKNGMARPAITAYKEVLKEFPWAMDAQEALLSLGLEEADLRGIVQEKVAVAHHHDWLMTWVEATAAFHAHDYSQALAIFKSLQIKTPLQNNNSVLVSIGTTLSYLGDYKNAITPLRAAQINDSQNMTGMDHLAYILWAEKRIPDLEKLMCRLVELNYSDNNSEPWIALAYYALLTNRGSRALYFAHRAVACSDHNNAEALMCQGFVMLNVHKYTTAVSSFREAMNCMPYRFEPHKGIVDCYIAMKRTRDAHAIFVLASKKMGETPRVLNMCASALKKDPLTVAKAKACLEKALAQDKLYLPAIFNLVDILEQEGKSSAAIQLLRNFEDSQRSLSPPEFYLRLAKLLCKINMDESAADQYELALRLDPSNRDAREGLNRLDPTSSRANLFQNNGGCYLFEDNVDVEEDDRPGNREGGVGENEMDLDDTFWSLPEFNLNSAS